MSLASARMNLVSARMRKGSAPMRRASAPMGLRSAPMNLVSTPMTLASTPMTLARRRMDALRRDQARTGPRGPIDKQSGPQAQRRTLHTTCYHSVRADQDNTEGQCENRCFQVPNGYADECFTAQGGLPVKINNGYAAAATRPRAPPSRLDATAARAAGDDRRSTARGYAPANLDGVVHRAMGSDWRSGPTLACIGNAARQCAGRRLFLCCIAFR